MKKIRLVITLFAVWFSMHEITIITDGLLSKPVKSEYAVILGNKINYNGTLSDKLKFRVLKGLNLYNDALV